MKKITFIVICALFIGCNSNNQSNDTEGQVTLSESMLTELIQRHDASGGTIMVLDVATGKLIENCTVIKDSNGNFERAVPDSIEPGSLGYPMLLADLMASGAVLDTSMMLKVGQKKYPCGYSVVDSRRIMDNGIPLDSVTLGRAFVERSKVAMCELAEMNCAAQTKVSDDFYMKALGYGEKMSPYDILQHYNAMAKGGSDTVVIRSLLARILVEGYTGRYADKDIVLAGMPATIAIPNETERNNAAFAGFYPAENPKYSCIVILYSTTSKGIDAADVAYMHVK